MDGEVHGKVLVANRGEIALRVMRTCRRLGMPSVAIFTAADRGAPHVRAADEAVEVSSYLDIDQVVGAARDRSCWAVHPGYGFLSENAAFARAVEDTEGLVLVGPSSGVMDVMGRKDAARGLAEAAGVPVVPSDDLDADPVTLRYPVLVKAAAGGGGKGMRVVRSAAELPEAVAAAQREARTAFGDDTILVERYVERGRHIEVQVMGDTHGTVLHLGERDCSAQRRHQKVVEEAPAPRLDPGTRDRIRAAAVDLAAHVDYTGAGTVEFLLDVSGGEFYFLEMNTRLQVEHPVTEAVTGLDLVELQLRVAAGEPIGLTQDQVRLDGHAIEARIYAEDPYAGFLPQAGRAGLVQWPAGVRVDHALESGQEVGTSYDPMLGKVVAYGPDRETAARVLVDALAETVILGLTTNVGFVRELVSSPEFHEARIDTAWLDRHEPVPPDPGPARRLAAWAVFDAERTVGGPFGSDGFRLGAEPAPVVVDLDEPVTLGERPPGTPIAEVHPDAVEIAWNGQRHVFPRPDAAADHSVAQGDGTLTAPMPGTVLDVRVAEGQSVTEGQVLGTMEAMKMELALTAPYAGTVTTVGAVAGAQVALGATLFVVEEP